MAVAYEVLSSEPTLQLVGPTTTREATLYTAQAVRSGFVYSALIDKVFTDAAPFVSYVKDVLEGRAAFMDELFDMPEVENAAIVQDVNAANQLAETLIVTVQSTSGKQLVQLPGMPFPRRLDQTQDAIRAAAAGLNAIEGG